MTLPCNILEFNGKVPRVAKTAYIDPIARIIGDVRLDDNVVVLYGTIIRGDDDYVEIHRNTVVLENSLIEAPRGHPVIIGSNALVSHGAIVHGAQVGDNALIGIGAIVLDGAKIGEEAIIGAGALVPPGKTIPPKTLALGIPAKPVKELTSNDIEYIRRELEAVHKKTKIYRKILPRTC